MGLKVQSVQEVDGFKEAVRRAVKNIEDEESVFGMIAEGDGLAIVVNIECAVPVASDQKAEKPTAVLLPMPNDVAFDLAAQIIAVVMRSEPKLARGRLSELMDKAAGSTVFTSGRVGNA